MNSAATSNFDEPFNFKSKAKAWCLAMMAVGTIGTIYGFLSGSAERTFANLLLMGYLVFAFALLNMSPNPAGRFPYFASHRYLQGYYLRRPWYCSSSLVPAYLLPILVKMKPVSLLFYPICINFGQ